MNLLKRDPYAELKEIISRVKSSFRALRNPLYKSRDVDYAGLNAALLRYEQDSRRTVGIEVTQSPQNKHTSDISNA